MYFWKIENLKEDIRAKQLTEKDRFIYMFISFVIIYLAILLVMIPDRGASMWGMAYYLLDSFIACLGTFLAFKANGGVVGVDFLGKYFSISFVVSLRFIPLFIILIIVTALTDYFFAFLDTEKIKTTLILDTLSLLVWQIALWWRIIKHTKDVREIQ